MANKTPYTIQSGYIPCDANIHIGKFVSIDGQPLTVQVNGVDAQPGHEIKPGDVITVTGNDPGDESDGE